MKRVAVITGDVNASSRLRQHEAKRLERVLVATYRNLKKHMPMFEAINFTCFRGDSWQFVVDDAASAASAAVYFRASLLVESHDAFKKKLNSAAAIGIGSIDFLPDGESTFGAGEAYELSGKQLDKIRRRIPGMSASGLGPLDIGVSASLGLIDVLIRHWTHLQARAVCLAFQGLTQKEIADRWHPKKVTQQAVHKHLHNAGWPAIEPALKWISTTIAGDNTENNHNSQNRRNRDA